MGRRRKEVAEAPVTERNLGTQLHYFRRKLYLRQPEMAERLGMSLSLYSKLEANRVTTPLRTIARIARILNTSVEFLQDGSGVEDLGPRQRTAEEIELAGATEEQVLQVVSLATREDLRRLAEQVAGNLNVSKEHALAMIIRTMLLGGGVPSDE